jgi:DNA-binding response OmpR family regulator
MGTILVVDDTLAMRYATSRVLSAAGFDVREVATGREALRLAYVADVILLDIDLPDIDGFEVCTRLKLARETRETPVIYKSAVFVQESDRSRGLALGADDFLIEPVEPPVLLAAIQRSFQPKSREQLTRNRIRRGDLPAPFETLPLMRPGTCQPCSGCEEPISGEPELVVDAAPGAALRFHAACHEAWARFTRR